MRPHTGRARALPRPRLSTARYGKSQFGYLYTYEINSANLPYAGFSRVSNFAGNGFSVEAFPAHTFTSAYSRVMGIRRLVAAGGAPPYQTNCFVGNLVDYTPNVTPDGTLTGKGMWRTGSESRTSVQVDVAVSDIGRFLELLRTYRDRAQFIVVTHQKRTMEAADCLYGVSMAGNGVSRVISRRLPAQEDEAAA